jgi:ABC-type lipoprotein export system ATPase subunit
MRDAAEPILQVENLHTWFFTDAGVVRAVDGVSFSLRPGETLGIVGESGSGKTTLAMALLALQPLAAGEVRLDGERVDNASRHALVGLRKRIQVVFQDPFASLSPRRTVEQIVGEGLEVHAPEIDPTERRAAIVAMLAEVGLEEGTVPPARPLPHEFSGGRRQRIAVARAVMPAGARPRQADLGPRRHGQRQVLALTRLRKNSRNQLRLYQPRPRRDPRRVASDRGDEGRAAWSRRPKRNLVRAPADRVHAHPDALRCARRRVGLTARARAGQGDCLKAIDLAQPCVARRAPEADAPDCP